MKTPQPPPCAKSRPPPSPKPTPRHRQKSYRRQSGGPDRTTAASEVDRPSSLSRDSAVPAAPVAGALLQSLSRTILLGGLWRLPAMTTIPVLGTASKVVRFLRRLLTLFPVKGGVLLGMVRSSASPFRPVVGRASVGLVKVGGDVADHGDMGAFKRRSSRLWIIDCALSLSSGTCSALNSDSSSSDDLIPTGR